MRLLLAIAILAASGFADQSEEGLLGVQSLGPGVYYRTPDGTWAKIEPISSQGFQSRAGFMSARAVTVYSAAAAAIQVADRRPTFYLKEPIPAMGMTVVTQGVSSSTTVASQEGQPQPPPTTPTKTLTRGETSSTYSVATQPQGTTNLVMVRLVKKKKHRELAYAGGSVFNYHSGIGTEDLVETAITPMEGGGYTLRSKADLKPGEYIIVTRGIMGMVGYGYGFDFGVTK